MSSKKKNWISTLVLIFVASAGYFIYQNSHWVTDYYQYYVYYPDIHGLLPSDPIYLKGARVGRISNIEYRGQKNILVTMSIFQNIPIQERTIAQLSASGLQGSKHINLLLDSATENILPHKSELLAQYDTTVIETSTLINPMLASAKYYVRSLDSSLTNINREMHNGFGRKVTRDIITLRNNLNIFAQSTNTLKDDVNNIANQLASFKVSSDSIVAGIDSMNSNIKGTSSSLSQLSKTTIKKDLIALSNNIKSFTKSIKKLEQDSSFRKLLGSDTLYNKTAGKFDTAKKKIKEVKDNPQPITILGN